MTEEKWTVVAEHFDRDKMEHYTLNWSIDNRYFSKLCGKSDGLSLNKDSMLLVLMKTITNYEIVTILELDNSYNQSQAEINKIKKNCDVIAEARGYTNINHCNGQPSDLMLSDDRLQIYKSFDLVQSLKKSIDEHISSIDELVSRENELRENIKNEENTLKKLKYMNSCYSEENLSKQKIEFMERKAAFDELGKRYRNGKKACEEVDLYAARTREKADLYANRIKQEADSYAARIKKEADSYAIRTKEEADLYAAKKIEEADLYAANKMQNIDSLDKKSQEYKKLIKIDKLLKEHHITYDELKQMIYDRELTIAKSNF